MSGERDRPGTRTISVRGTLECVTCVAIALGMLKLGADFRASVVQFAGRLFLVVSVGAFVGYSMRGCEGIVGGVVGVFGVLLLGSLILAMFFMNP